jgi:hypothetical protein
MEFDKCVAVWLITRFIDSDARFRFVPSGTEITEGIPFDVPGADWSRQHLKCTSMCILESIDCNDPAVEKIVDMAAKVELNFWQLDRWPEVQRQFLKIKEITEECNDISECFKKTNTYFDNLYRYLERN